MQNAEFIERISPFSTNQYSYIMQQLLNSEINIKSEPNKKKNIQASSICTKVFVFKIKKTTCKRFCSQFPFLRTMMEAGFSCVTLGGYCPQLSESCC